ncbi:MAG: M50 family metallopeptidase [Nanoarchaeota archaeon]|nr:M50 family metallopeptidase [Nanoarchaeota archaeon]
MIPITSLSEIMSIIVVTVVIGYIFSGYIPKGISFFREGKHRELKFAIALTAPAIILHELGHKFASMIFGIPAYFHMWTFGLVIGLIMKFLHFPFLILAPGYVGIEGTAPPPAMLAIAFAGPLVNLILYFTARHLLTTRHIRVKNRRFIPLLILTQKINLWLFIFNMLPIPPLDGSKVFGNLIKIIF